ncbi:FadR/GntR family transcriptional regulator [Agrobacterium sp.]|uniref:FadR/GntR family transcriptional regulator n=1 Tax=Agrobacterium sp. TaxID=361 RepID=UPI0028A96CB8|nr:FadR/GntR family transcriptional regulator [Agrobacterium sp.]
MKVARPRTSHAQVVHKLGQGIVSGEFLAGEILPGDADLVARFKVSRTILREAMKTLTAKGMVAPKARIGTRVTSRDKWNMFDSDVLHWHFEAGINKEFLLHLYDMRQAFEPFAASLAASRASHADIARLEMLATTMGDPAYSKEKRAIADMEFHIMLAEVSGNPFMRTVGTLIRASLTGIFRMSNPETDPNEIGDVSRTHLRLVEALRAKDATSARKQMETLIENGRNQIMTFVNSRAST